MTEPQSGMLGILHINGGTIALNTDVRMTWDHPRSVFIYLPGTPLYLRLSDDGRAHVTAVEMQSRLPWRADLYVDLQFIYLVRHCLADLKDLT